MSSRRWSASVAALLILASACTQDQPAARPQPSPRGVPQGSSAITDVTNDVVTADGKPARKAPPGVDLVGVKLAASSSMLDIEFQMRGAIPKDSGPGQVLDGKDELAWVLDTWVWEAEYQRTYHVEVRLLKTAWTVSLVSFIPSSREEILPVTPKIGGRSIAVSIPLNKLPELGKVFGWTTRTRWALTSGTSKDGPLGAGGDFAPERFIKDWRAKFG